MFTPVSDAGWFRIAKQLYAQNLKEEVLDFFEENPNPSDDDLHDWAEKEGYDPHEVEEIVYSLLTESLKKDVDSEDGDEYDEEEDGEWDDQMEGGLADDSDPDDYDLDQILKGIEIEFEHTDDPETALEIAMDHLEETDNYYDMLSEMESGAKK